MNSNTHKNQKKKCKQCFMYWNGSVFIFIPTFQPADFVDNSGVRLHLTPTLRQYDAGILYSGVNVHDLQIIPPFEKEFESSGFCTPECLDKVTGFVFNGWLDRLNLSFSFDSLGLSAGACCFSGRSEHHCSAASRPSIDQEDKDPPDP